MAAILSRGDELIHQDKSVVVQAVLAAGCPFGHQGPFY